MSSSSGELKRHLAAAEVDSVLSPVKRYKPSEIEEKLLMASAAAWEQNAGLKLLLSSIDFGEAYLPAAAPLKSSSPPPSSSSSSTTASFSSFSSSSSSPSSSAPSTPPPCPHPYPVGGSAGSISPLLMSAAALSSATPPPSSPSVSSVSPSPCSPLPSTAGSAASVVCYYPVVAQKSYGEEKRFLCPPPTLSMSPSSSSSSSASSLLPPLASFCATVVTDDGGKGGSDSHQAVIDETGKACFKALHVTSASRSKSFHLQIRAAEGTTTLTSRPIAIVSKPSKKTLKGNKGGDASTAIFSGSLVSLYNRVNSQTVRTKFLGNEKNQLSARNSTWTPFAIYLAENGAIKECCTPTPVLYNQEVVLRDLETGFCSEPLILQRADKPSSEVPEGSPVTHLQKVRLQSRRSPGQFLTVSQALFGSNDPMVSFQRPGKGPDAIPEDLMAWSIVGIEKTTLPID